MSGKILFSLVSIAFVFAAAALDLGLYSLMRFVDDTYFHWFIILIMCAIPIGLSISLFMAYDIMRVLWTDNNKPVKIIHKNMV